jgi:hypothetical protein
MKVPSLLMNNLDNKFLVVFAKFYSLLLTRLIVRLTAPGCGSEPDSRPIKMVIHVCLKATMARVGYGRWRSR